MKILIVYAHPEPSSFNAALKNLTIETLKDQHEIQLSDLYSMHFKPNADWEDFKEINPLLPKQYSVVQQDAYLHNNLSNDIITEQKKLSWCDGIIFQFPLWWFGPPAILKGWLDRVLAGGFAYDKDKWFETGLLKPRQALLSTTTQSSAMAYLPDGMHGVIDQYLKPIHHTLRFAGITPGEPFAAYGVMNIDDQLRKDYLKKFREHLLLFVNSLNYC